MTNDDVLELVREWAAAEQDNDGDQLDAMLVVGVDARETTFGDRDVSGRFRVTLTAVRPENDWQVAAVHIGALQAGPPTGAGVTR